MCIYIIKLQKKIIKIIFKFDLWGGVGGGVRDSIESPKLTIPKQDIAKTITDWDMPYCIQERHFQKSSF